MCVDLTQALQLLNSFGAVVIVLWPHGCLLLSFLVFLGDITAEGWRGSRGGGQQRHSCSHIQPASGEYPGLWLCVCIYNNNTVCSTVILHTHSEGVNCV